MKEPIVTAEKTMHKGAMHGHISNCGGTIDLGNGKAIRFIGLNNTFLTLQLLDYGVGVNVKTSSWRKTKVKKEVVIKEVEKKPEEKERGVIEVVEEVKARDLF